MEFPKLGKESLKASPTTSELPLPQKVLKRDYIAVCSGESVHSKSNKKLRPSDSENNIETLCAAIPKLREYFKLSRRIGCGTFSNVYLGSWKNKADDIADSKFALKHIFSSSHPDRVLSEVKCLKLIGGENYVVGMECCIRQNGESVLVLPYVKHDRFKKLLEKMSMVDVQEYIRQLLTALRHVHSHNIIHRDVKPNNFLYDIETKKGGLVDFGLAQYAPVPKKTTSNNDMTAAATKQRRNSTHVTSSNQLSLRPLSKRRCLSEIQNNVNIKAGLAASASSSGKPLKKGIKGIKSHSFSSNDDIMAKKRKKFSGHFMTTSPKVFASDKISLSERHSPFSSLKIGDIFPSIRKYEASSKWKGGSSSRSKDKCSCFDKLKVCRKCLARPHPSAPRAGTSGFRPPEVLLKHKEQTTAVDIWASGIILISILSGRCPFFPAIHDLESLVILMSVFGTKKIEDMAKSCGKHVNYSEHFDPVDLKDIVLKLRRSSHTCDSKKSSSPRRSPRHHWCTDNALPTHAPFLAEEIPDACFDLLFKLLDVNPFTRITAADALKHDFFNLQFSVLH